MHPPIVNVANPHLLPEVGVDALLVCDVTLQERDGAGGQERLLALVHRLSGVVHTFGVESILLFGVHVKQKRDGAGRKECLLALVHHLQSLLQY